MTTGVPLMPMLPAEFWVFLTQVRYTFVQLLLHISSSIAVTTTKHNVMQKGIFYLQMPWHLVFHALVLEVRVSS